MRFFIIPFMSFLSQHVPVRSIVPLVLCFHTLIALHYACQHIPSVRRYVHATLVAEKEPAINTRVFMGG